MDTPEWMVTWSLDWKRVIVINIVIVMDGHTKSKILGSRVMVPNPQHVDVHDEVQGALYDMCPLYCVVCARVCVFVCVCVCVCVRTQVLCVLACKWGCDIIVLCIFRNPHVHPVFTCLTWITSSWL
jgi:hypothetical protein